MVMCAASLVTTLLWMNTPNLLHLPLVFILVLFAAAKENALLYLLTSIADTAIFITRTGLSDAGFAYIKSIGMLICALFIAFLGLIIFVDNDMTELMTGFVLNRTKSRRGYYASLSAVTLLGSFAPEFGAALGAGLFSECGRKIGVSREKTAFLSNAVAVFAQAVVLIFSCAPILGAVRAGLDAAGGADVAEYAFFKTTIQFFYFPISLLIIILMEIIKLRDFGPLYTAEKTARQSFCTKRAKELSEAYAGNKIFVLKFIPVFLCIAVFLLGIVLNMERSATALAASAVFLVSSIIKRTLFEKKSFATLISVQLLRDKLPAKQLLVSAFSALIMVTAMFGDYSGIAAGVVSENIHLYLLAIVSGVIGFVISFITGNPVIAIAAVLPTSIPTTWFASGEVIYYTMAVGCVVSGAYAGYMCSPVSPVTVSAAVFSSCDIQSHSRNMLVYASFTFGCTLIFGYLPISIGFTTAFGLLITLFGTHALFETLSRSVDRKIIKL